MDKFEKPSPVTRVDTTFGGNLKSLMPLYSEVPDEFKRSSHPWCQWQQKWFYSGLDKDNLPKPKAGINQGEAMAHLAAIQRSWDCKHEHKEAAVAYLASKWFESP